MPEITYGEAINYALRDELASDNSVVLFGEDIVHNLYGYTDGLFDRFGGERVRNIPLSEAGVVGLASGAAMCGLRPIIDLTVPNFLFVAMDQIVSIASKSIYMSNGQYNLPITVMTSSLAGSGSAAQHSDRLHSLFSGISGLKVISPATPQDMYSMLREAVRDNSPVLCFADRKLTWTRENVDFDLKVPIGKCRVVKEGSDLTIISVSACLKMINESLSEIEKTGISAEIIDVRSIAPLDFKTIKQSVEKTGRVLICDTSNKSGSIADEIASLISQNCLNALKQPVEIVAAENIPVPFVKVLEDEILVSADKIMNRIKEKFGDIR